MERTLDFDSFDLGAETQGSTFNPNNVTQTHSNFSRNKFFATFFFWTNFYDLDLSKTIWTQPKSIGPVQNDLY